MVTGPGAPAIASVDDLSGQEVFVRKSSSYHESLLALNERLEGGGQDTGGHRETRRRTSRTTTCSRWSTRAWSRSPWSTTIIADFWKQVFTDLTVHDDVAVRTGGNLAVAIRKNSPQLAAELNAFIDEYGLGTAFGNMMEKRYLQSTKLREERHVRGRAQEVPGDSWSSSRSTATSTTWTTC